MSVSFGQTIYTDDSNKSIKFLRKAVSKLKCLKLPSSSSSSCTPADSKHTGCYAICVDNLGPIQIPSFFVPPSANHGKIEVLFHCSLFDANERAFVGRTWKSNALPSNGPVGIQKYWFYLKSIPTESKWIVIELVAQLRDEGVIQNQISLGWNVIEIFANTRALIDVHPDENNNDPLQRESKLKTKFLFQGSPTYLLINSDISSIPESAIKFTFRLFTFKKLMKIQHLLSNDSMIGGENLISGLGAALRVPPSPYDRSWQHLFDIKPTDFVISSPVLTLPQGLEAEILDKLTKIRKENFGGSDATVATIMERELVISFYNAANIITVPCIIQVNPEQSNPNVLRWDGDIKVRVNANLQDNCWLLVSLNVRIEWKDDPSSPQAPAYHHCICVGRELINITSDQLNLAGHIPTTLTLSPKYAWIDDQPVFNNKRLTQNLNNSVENKVKLESQQIGVSLTMTLVDGMRQNTNPRPATIPIAPPAVPNTMSRAIQLSSRSNSGLQQTPKPQPPKLSAAHHIASFDLKPPSIASETPHTTNHFSVHVDNDHNNNVLASPQGFVPMSWDEIRKQSQLMIPDNVLQNKFSSSSKLGILQETFALNTWRKLHGDTYPMAKTLKPSFSARSLRGGYPMFDASPYDVAPNRKLIDVERELQISHKRMFSIACTALRIKVKQLFVNPVQSVVIQLDFMGDKVISPPMMISSNSTMNLRESLMDEDKYELMVFSEIFKFEFNILPNQIREFVQFLNERYAIFTVWNANTMYQIGSCRVCFRDLLLQDYSVNNCVQQSNEIPICYTKQNTKPISVIETQPNIAISNTQIYGKLCIEVTHQALDLSDTAKLQYIGWSDKLITNIYDQQGSLCVRHLKLMKPNNQRITPSSLYKNAQLTPKLQKLSVPAEMDSVMNISTKWNIPMEAINANSKYQSSENDKEWQIRSGNIETMADFRQRKKQEMLTKLAEPDQYTIQPSMGQTVFFEIEFKNPWNKAKKFQIEISDPIASKQNHSKQVDELQLVTNIKEMSYLKEKYNASTVTKRQLFEKQDTNQIQVNDEETVYIPFKFQSFACGSKQDGNSFYPRVQPGNNEKTGDGRPNPIQSRIINVAIYNIDDEDAFHSQQNKENQKMPVIEFNICVEPIAFCIDRIFDIYAAQNSKFVAHLPLPSIRNSHATHDEQVLSVRCSSNDTAFEFDEKNENITFRCDIHEYSAQNRFYFMIYNDRYCIDINEIWEINLCSYFSENCHGMLGGIIQHNIHLPSFMEHANMDQIQFHCDQHNGIELGLTENDHKMLLNVQYAPAEIGKTLMRIHCVDNLNDCILYSCLLVIHVEMPKINNSFVIYVENSNDEDCDDVVTRKLPYSNGYNQERVYELVSNDPSIIRINNPMLQIPAESSMEFILQVMPKNISGHSQEVLLFVTEGGNVEQCLRIEVRKGKVTNL
eukprot:CAMPEP_0197074046 /NCGR_PEP_ID=MMETSP1384-20130603/210909_1 /TAXON_ID=29189 /ORGANISM="Ammonia sp." /LENGTH=1427 /DNA_ID=CAMNT_0042512887 /DNA_START=28 /DNA_END=4311 /DNA_ORIENTATION=-